jgi:ribonuclease BN (tRNA processing enzyme)
MCLMATDGGRAEPSGPAVRGAAHRATLELIVLGSGGPRAFGRGATSYVVLVEGTPRILVDAGAGAFVESGRLGLDLERMDLVLLTHLHIDHTSDLPALFNARALTARAPIRFRVFGPEGAAAFPGTTQFIHLMFEKHGAYEYQKTFGADESISVADLPTALDSPQREIVAESDLRVTTIPTHHGDCPSVAYRVESGQESITFAGDMDASAIPNLERIAKVTDLLVVHAAVQDPPGEPEILYTLHTPPRALGEAAHAAGARSLLLSHIPPVVEHAQAAVLQSIRASYRGPVTFATDGLRVPVRP